MKSILLGLICLINIVILLLMCVCNSANAQDSISINKQRRKVIPVDQLKLFLEAQKRVQTMQPEKVMGVLGVEKGETVADIGAGTGFFSFYLSRMVGTGGKVYAVEIEDELLDFIREKMAAQNVTNIIPVKSSETAPNLPQSSCDKILIANTYIYFDDPVAFMKNVRPALKSGGLVAIIEVDAGKLAQAKRKLLLGTKGRNINEVIDEMKKAGFILRSSHDFLESRFFMVFSPIK